MTEVSIDSLVRPDRLGPALAETTADERWVSFEASLISGGKSNLTFELTSPAGALILRRPPSGDLLPSAHDMGREARVQRALRGSTVPVPRVVMQGTSADLLGVPFYVMEKVPGHVVREELPAGYAESEADKVAMTDVLVDVLAELHSVDPEAVGLSDFGRPEGYLERQIRRWIDQWERSKTRDVPAVEELARRVGKRLPAEHGSAIVHGDYRFDNCLMHLEDPSRIVAVLDWEMSTLGDPLTDVGLLMLYWREPGQEVPSLTPAVTTQGGFPGRMHIVERYVQRTGADVSEIGFYDGFAHLKFAVIAQGIAVRAASGAMAGQEFGDIEDEVVKVAELGLSRMDEER